jgi:hypothetical protein
MLRIDRKISEYARLFLGNGSVNTFPWEWTGPQQKKSCVFYVVRAEML